MNEKELEQIVERVAAELFARMGAVAPTVQNDGKAKILVVGASEEVPPQLTEGVQLCPLSEYEASKNILRYEKVVITQLSLLQLADIALGRADDAACCAVLSALLAGKEVDLLESGLPHRKYAGKGSTGLYAKLEEYVRTIQGYGAKMLTAERLYQPKVLPVKPAKFQPQIAAVPTENARPNFSSLITEEIALKLASEHQDEVIVPRGAILTPSAQDVFSKARIAVKKVNGGHL